MDNSWDIASYFGTGLHERVRGTVSGRVNHDRDLCVIHGWAKDMPFTAVIYIGSPREVVVDQDQLQSLIDRLDLEDPPLRDTETKA